MPAVIAWGQPQLLEFEEHDGIWWGLMFELLPGGSGFASQARHHGFCGLPAELVKGESYQLKRGQRRAQIMALDLTQPVELEPHVDAIIADYAEQLQRLGITVA